MTTTLRRADRIPPVGHAEAMRLTEAENARLLAQLRGRAAWTEATLPDRWERTRRGR